MKEVMILNYQISRKIDLESGHKYLRILEADGVKLQKMKKIQK